MYDIAPHPDFNFKVGDVVLRLPSIPDPGEGEGSASADGAAEAAAPMEEAAAGGAGQDSLSGLLLTRATRWAASLAGGALRPPCTSVGRGHAGCNIDGAQPQFLANAVVAPFPIEPAPVPAGGDMGQATQVKK